MKYKKYLLVAAALVVIGAASIKPAMAYFTDTQEATGKIELHLGDSKIIPDEHVEGMTKIITVSNTGDYDVFVRVKAVYGSNFDVSLTEDSKNNGWSDGGDGYYYYKDIVTKKGTDNSSSKEIKLDISVKDASIASNGFNIVIIQEATRVFYNEDGTTKSNWKDKIIVESDEAVDVTTESTENQGAGEETAPTETPDNNNSGEGNE